MSLRSYKAEGRKGVARVCWEVERGQVSGSPGNLIPEDKVSRVRGGFLAEGAE